MNKGLPIPQTPLSGVPYVQWIILLFFIILLSIYLSMQYAKQLSRTDNSVLPYIRNELIPIRKPFIKPNHNDIYQSLYQVSQLIQRHYTLQDILNTHKMKHAIKKMNFSFPIYMEVYDRHFPYKCLMSTAFPYRIGKSARQIENANVQNCSVDECKFEKMVASWIYQTETCEVYTMNMTSIPFAFKTHQELSYLKPIDVITSTTPQSNGNDGWKPDLFPSQSLLVRYFSTIPLRIFCNS